MRPIAPSLLASICLLLGLLLLAGTSGCGGNENGYNPTGAYQSLRFALTTDKSVYNRGEAVNFTFTATNDGSQPVRVFGPIGLLVAQVMDGDSPIAYCCGGPSASAEVTIAPGETLSLPSFWDQTRVQGDGNLGQVSAGVYSIRAKLGADSIDGVALPQPNTLLDAPPVAITIR